MVSVFALAAVLLVLNLGDESTLTYTILIALFFVPIANGNDLFRLLARKCSIVLRCLEKRRFGIVSGKLGGMLKGSKKMERKKMAIDPAIKRVLESSLKEFFIKYTPKVWVVDIIYFMHYLNIRSK